MTKYILGLVLLCSFQLKAQVAIQGQVLDEKGMPLPQANVYAPLLNQGVATDLNGNFSMEIPENSYPVKLIFSYVGFQSDTLLSKPNMQVMLAQSSLEEVVVEEEQDKVISFLNERDVEQLNTGELRKAACCNLSESFESNPSVNVSFSDAVSGAKRIQLLGLDGKYAQILLDGSNLLEGSESVYGIGLIPGPWISSLQLVKGAGSVLQGSSSITGQINLSLFDAKKNPEVQLDAFGSSHGRMEFNAVVPYFKGDFEHVTMLHYGTFQHNLDRNEDGFLDAPNRSTNGIFQQYKYNKGNFRSKLNLVRFEENLLSGSVQTTTNYEGNTNFFGVRSQRTKNNASLRLGYVFERPATSIGWVNKVNRSEQDLYLGNFSLDDRLNTASTALLFSSYLGNTNHTYTIGADLNHTDYTANGETGLASPYINSLYSNDLSVFGEYTFKYGEAISIVTGLRGTQTAFHDFLLLPRLNMRYQPAENWVLRANIGRGFRYTYPYAESYDFFANNRNLIRPASPFYELATNAGASIAWNGYFDGFNVKTKAEVFATQFENQLVVDRETAGELYFTYQSGNQAISAMISNTLELGEQWEYDLSFQLNRSYATQGNEYQQNPLMPYWRILHGLDWSNPLETSKASLILQQVGPVRLPNHPGIAEEFSEPFLNAQVQFTKRFRKFEAYLGVQNLFNTIQENPILDHQNQMGTNFDASLIYAPIQGRRMYGGIRFNFEYLEK